MTKNYVNKEKFYQDICDWQDALKLAKENGTKEPVMPNSIGVIVLDIAERMSTRYNFRNYSYREEMVGDGIVAAVRAIPLFKREHAAKNPFGFLTFVIWRAFVNRLKSEKAEHEGRMSMMLDASYDGFDLDEADADMRVGRDKMMEQYSH